MLCSFDNGMINICDQWDGTVLNYTGPNIENSTDVSLPLTQNQKGIPYTILWYVKTIIFPLLVKQQVFIFPDKSDNTHFGKENFSLICSFRKIFFPLRRFLPLCKSIRHFDCSSSTRITTSKEETSYRKLTHGEVVRIARTSPIVCQGLW